MGVNEANISELVRLALVTTNINEMRNLADNVDINVRRSLCKNPNIDIGVLKILSNDPVQNVSYYANLNPMLKEKREFENVRPCVSCEKNYSEVLNSCLSCDLVKGHRF